jgi:hypothetical protein
MRVHHLRLQDNVFEWPGTLSPTISNWLAKGKERKNGINLLMILAIRLTLLVP